MDAAKTKMKMGADAGLYHGRGIIGSRLLCSFICLNRLISDDRMSQCFVPYRFEIQFTKSNSFA